MPDLYQQLGIVRWIANDTGAFAAPSPTVSADMQVANDHLNALRQQVATCTLCSLHQTRTQTVFGAGNPQADLMIIGEAPGLHEDQQGEPFVGRSGQLLTLMIKAIGLKREDVFITTIIKCHPPNNRDPQVEEVRTCTPYLIKQIQIVKPKLLLAVGGIAADYLLQTKSPLDTLRQKIHAYGDHQTPLIITYHPTYLLHNPIDKRKAFADLQFAQHHLA